MEGPSALVFALFFMAQHLNAKGEHKLALQYVDEALLHTPTLINLYICKARIFKNAGDVQEASRQMEIARKLDLADR